MQKGKYDSLLTKLATPEEARQRYRVSRGTLMKIAKNENAVIRFGRSVRIDIQKLDAALTNYTYER